MVIRGNADAVLADLPADDAAREALGDIVAAADRAEGLTRQILAFSRRQVLRPARVELSAAVPAIQRLLEQAVGPQVRLEIRLCPDAGGIRADATQLSQLLINLAVNARDAMPDGGTLTIETTAVTLTRGTPHVHGVVPPGTYSMLTVRDTGVGMSEATLARIFEPFFTTKPRGRGTGLGLATVYGIVQQSGGHLTVASRPGEGTTFVIYFPQLAPEPAPPADPAGAPTTAGGHRVLVVDDEPAVRRITQRILKQGGFAVTTADGAESALALLATDATRGTLPHVVLTDVQMPGLGGRELGDRIAARFPDLPVLYMSGYTTDDLLSQHLVRDGQHIIVKPFTAETLVAAVKEAALRTHVPPYHS
jgi:CheY-like chemotaxis protein